MYYAFEGAAPPPRAGAAHATIYPYGPFPAGDGKLVMLGLQNEREWQVFCAKVLEQPGAGDRSALRVQHAAHRRARGAARDHRAGVRAASPPRRSSSGSTRRRSPMRRSTPCRTSGSHPQLQARGRWTEVGTRRRPDPRAAAARHAAASGDAAHGRGAGAGPAHRRDPGASSATTRQAIAALHAEGAV